MTQYDPKVINEFADRLYAQANSIIMTHTSIGALAGCVAGYAAGHGSDSAGVFALVLGAVGGGMGFSIGKQKAFTLKLQAQTALCQAKIEENTRRA